MFFYIFSKFSLLGSIVGQKSKKWPEMTKKYVCASTLYLSKHTSHDSVFSLHKFKMMTSENAFFISKFWFSGLLGWRGLKRKKMAQNDKKCSLTLYLRNCTSDDCGFWNTCVKWWYLQQRFSFFLKSDFSGFLKFINKHQKKILRCAPPSSHM